MPDHDALWAAIADAMAKPVMWHTRECCPPNLLPSPLWRCSCGGLAEPEEVG